MVPVCCQPPLGEDTPVCLRVRDTRAVRNRGAEPQDPCCLIPNGFPSPSITELSNGSSSTTQLPTSTFLNTAPAEGEDVERVSTGTKFALQLWLESLREQG